MKAIVAEIDKKQMIVVTDKGDFIKVKRQMSAGIGDEIEIKSRKIYQTYKNLARVAACLMACIFLSTGVYAYYTPYSYISVDINPSIALSLNRFERVIAVKPLNEDAVNLLENTKGLKNHDVDDVLSKLIKSASEEGFIDVKAENQVMVVVSAQDGKQEKELADSLTITAVNELAKVNNSYDVMVEKTSIESHKTALSNNMSPGKEILAGRLKEISPELNADEIQNMSVKEVTQRIKEGKKAAKELEKAAKEAEKAAKEKSKDNSKEATDLGERNNDKDKSKAEVKAAADTKKDKRDKGEKTKAGAAASVENNDNKEVRSLESETSEEKEAKDKVKDKDKDEKKDDKKGLEKEVNHNGNKNIKEKDNDNDKGTGNDKN